ncbi:MAG: protein-glutamate O-methyltransferase CheR [Myxococcales bacterium]|nr:protein-glutamate O-methyltransferase CheR [Myxococcales bacterium]MDD9971082.1 protein-glutamate O-methyltransferase CheR [Myxococcales bacterium]
MESSTIQREDFAWLCQMLRDETAIVVDAAKAYLVEARLLPLARSKGMPVAELIRRARADTRAEKERRQVIEAMTTNETSFFRDRRIFDSITDQVVGRVLEEQKGEIRIWCAAASTGQEPYSLAMALASRYPSDQSRVRIVASDIDTQALARARLAEYSQLELSRGLPSCMKKYFDRQGDRWRIRQEIREMVEFRQLNLVKPWPSVARMDLVLVRNVLIYFEPKVKAEILTRMARKVLPTGFIILGSTESALGCDVPLRAQKIGQCTVYSRTAS